MDRPAHVDVAVIGAGPAGLAAAYRLRRRCEVRLFERRDRIGGRAASVRSGGYLVDLGANILREDDGPLDRLTAELHLEAAKVYPGSRARTRYLVRNGRPVPRPTSPLGLLTTPLLSPGAKLRLLYEPFVAPAVTSPEETLASFVRRRLGPEVLAYGAEPLAAGMFAGRPEGLGLAHAMPALYETVREHGSLGRAWMHRWGRALLDRLGVGGEKGEPTGAPDRSRSNGGPPSGGGSNGGPSNGGAARAGASSPGIFTFRGGTATLLEAMAARLGDRAERGVRIRDLRPTEAGGFRFVAEGRSGARPWRADRVICAVPACRLDDLWAGPAGETDRLAAVPYPPLAVAAIGYEAAQLAGPIDGLGMLVPEREPYDLAGVLFSSSIAPDRAPAGRVLLTCFAGGMRAPELARRPDELLLDSIRSDLEDLLDVSGSPEFVRIQRWEHAIPQYGPGYEEVLQAAEAFEQRHPGLFLAGSYRDGVSMSDALASGWDAAGRALGRP